MKVVYLSYEKEFKPNKQTKLQRALLLMARINTLQRIQVERKYKGEFDKIRQNHPDLLKSFYTK